MSGAGKPAVFLDRDGVINDLVADSRSGTLESPYKPEDVRILPDVGQALEALSAAGFTLVVASNQPAAAKGLVSADDLDRVHHAVVEALGPDAALISRWCYCRHHPDAIDPALRRCDCRKPKPALLLRAAAALGLDLRRSWMVGDSDRDTEAGIAAGCRTVLIEHSGSAHRRLGSVKADVHAVNLLEATGELRPRAR